MLICEQCKRDADPPKCWWCDSPIDAPGCPPEFQEAVSNMVFEWNGSDILMVIYSGRAMWFPFHQAASTGTRMCLFLPSSLPLFSWMAEHNVRIGMIHDVATSSVRFHMDVAMSEKMEDYWFAPRMISYQDIKTFSKGGKIKFTFGAGVLP